MRTSLYRGSSIRFIDLDTWTTTLTARGRTFRFYGRPAHPILLSPAGITACDSVRNVTHHNMPKPPYTKTTAAETSLKALYAYQVHLDGQTKPEPVTVGVDRLERTNSGEVTLYRGDLVVAFYRFVRSVRLIP